MSIPNPARDPDGFFGNDEAPRPDPAAMLARSMLGSGLPGSLLDRIDRALEAREERRFARRRATPPAGGKPASIAAGRLAAPIGPDTSR